MFKNILKDLDGIKEKLKNELEEMAKMTIMLKEEGIDFLDSTQVPNFALFDRRLTSEAKVLYYFLHSVNKHQQEGEALNHKAVAETLKLEREEYKEAMDLLRVLGLVIYNEENGHFELPTKANVNEELISKKFEEMKLNDDFVNANSVEELADALDEKAIDLGENVKVKPVNINAEKGNVYRQIFEKVMGEIAINIPDGEELGKINVEIDFNTGVANVNIERIGE